MFSSNAQTSCSAVFSSGLVALHLTPVSLIKCQKRVAPINSKICMTQAKSETNLLREHKNHFSLDATLSVQGCYLKFALVFSFQSLCTHLKLESTFSGDVDVMRRKCFLHFKKVHKWESTTSATVSLSEERSNSPVLIAMLAETALSPTIGLLSLSLISSAGSCRSQSAPRDG